jgi:hypothetical protein
MTGDRSPLPAADPPPPDRGPTGAGKLAVGALVAVGLVVAVTTVLGGYARHTTETFGYPDEAVTVVVVTGDAGDIRVRHIQGDAPQVRVTRTVSSSSLSPRVDARLTGGTLTLTARCWPPGVGTCSVDYEIEVGDRQAAYRLHSTSGDVEMSWAAPEVEAVADAGSVTLTNAGGRVTATAAGDVRVTCLVHPVYLGGFSTRGSVALRLPQGPGYNVSTATRGGRVRVDVARQEGGAMQIVAGTTDGDITVTN